jgi:hypothetical protein
MVYSSVTEGRRFSSFAIPCKASDRYRLNSAKAVDATFSEFAQG